VDHIENASIEAENLTSASAIVSAVHQATRAMPDESKFSDEIQALESQWASGSVGTSRLVAGVLENDASQFLREYNRVVVGFREILVTDRYGRLVAATNKVSDYFQADENWWRVSYLEGEGQRYVSDVQFDDSARVYCVEIALPVRERTTQEVIGILKSIIDSDAVFGMLDSSKFGENTVAVLMREDGSIVTDPQSGGKYPFVERIRSEMNFERRYTQAPAESPRVFLGLPTFSVNDRIPELDWTLVIQAPYEEVYSPLRQLKTWFLYIVIFSISLVIIFSIVFTWILSRPIVETDPHLERV
jgi:hypothetical protein